MKKVFYQHYIYSVGRELLIEEVYTKANNSRANFRNYDEPETPKKNV